MRVPVLISRGGCGRAALLGVLLLCATAKPSAAEFPTLYNSEPADARPMPASQALQKLALPAGFHATLFAAEPAVQNPIALAWDHRGRMWVAENYTYSELPRRFDLGLRDRVIILEDRDHDGVAESRKVFIDDVQILTSVEIGHGGVWLMCPPRLLFVPDANGDDVPDGPPQVMLDGFTIGQDNYHNFANGLHWGPDGWLYGRCGHSCPGRLGVPGTPDAQRVPIKGGIWRYHPGRKVVEVVAHGTTNPWGSDWDATGEGFFVNSVTGQLWHLIPGAHFKEAGVDPNPGVYERLEMHADHWHFDTRGGMAVARDGKADAFGGGHAHAGTMIYQAEQWPDEWRDRLFTLNLHGRRANVERLDRTGSGYIGRHQADVFLSGDPWFRGIEMSQGPDGSAYVLDWSDQGECHERTGVHRTSGRIFKLMYGEPKPPSFDGFAHPTPKSVEDAIRNPNVWFERRMRERLASGPRDSAYPDIGATLRRILRADPSPIFRLRALWAWYALGDMSEEELGLLLQNADEHVRAWAIRLLSDGWPIDAITGPTSQTVRAIPDSVRARLQRLATTDPSALVRLVIASTLQRLPVGNRAEIASALVRHAEDKGDHNLPSLVWYGLIPLGESDPLALVQVAEASQWPDTSRWIAHNLAAQIEARPEPVNRLVKLAAHTTDELRHSILTGLSEGLSGWHKAPKPAAWDALIATPGLTNDGVVRDLSALFGDGRALEALKRFALDGKADPARRQAALEAIIGLRPPDLRELCESLLTNRVLGVIAVHGLAQFDDPAVGRAIAGRLSKYPAPTRAAMIDLLVTRPAWADALLEQVASHAISRSLITPFHARQIRGLANAELTRKLKRVWGDVRDSSAEKREQIRALQASLRPAVLAQADLARGRQLFSTICATCHTLYGEGGVIGPDLTGSNRANLDFLLESIVDPSAEIGPDFRVTSLTLADGRVVSGIVTARNGPSLKLRQLSVETTIPLREIREESTSAVSIMPDGLLTSLAPEQISDLIAYLMYPTQVPLPEGSKH